MQSSLAASEEPELHSHAGSVGTRVQNSVAVHERKSVAGTCLAPSLGGKFLNPAAGCKSVAGFGWLLSSLVVFLLWIAQEIFFYVDGTWQPQQRHVQLSFGILLKMSQMKLAS